MGTHWSLSYPNTTIRVPWQMTKPKEPKNNSIEFLSFVALFCITSSLSSAWAARRKDLQMGFWTNAWYCEESSSYQDYCCNWGGVSFFADDPQRGPEKVAPNAAAKCVFQLVMGVIMALPRKTIAFHPSWVLKQENESVEITRFLKRLQFGGSWSPVKHRAGWLVSAVVAKSSLASLGWGMMLLPISAVPSHPSLLSASCCISFLPLLVEE